MRNKNGQFIKGVSVSANTQFKKGEHWRKPQSFREKEWLQSEYVDKKRSSKEIATEFNVTDAAVLFWLRKHGIARRTISETREIKYWGQVGIDNPMWNRRGELNPRWLGGITPERQEFYQSHEWKNACSDVWKRDNATCQRCELHRDEQKDMPFHIHHIVSFKVKDLRADITNLVLLCEVCHNYVHSKNNINGEFISEV